MLSDVVGQPEAVAYLQKVVQGSLRSPLMLLGDEGVGRRFSIFEAIREIVAVQKGADSSECLQVLRGVHPDVTFVTAPSEKELGVEPMRDIVAQAQSYPTAAPSRFFIIDGAERLTVAAANALLKTLEEPPAASLFFLLAESYDRVLPTIRSRCGRVPYRKLPESFIFERMCAFEADRDKALVYARMGEGSVGRAARFWGSNRLVMRDQAYSLLQAAAAGDLSGSFSTIEELAKELPLLLTLLRFVVHDVLVSRVDSARVVNQDILEDLISMRTRAKIETWVGVWKALKVVSNRYESSYINLGFHLKTSIATAFG